MWLYSARASLGPVLACSLRLALFSIVCPGQMPSEEPGAATAGVKGEAGVEWEQCPFTA